MTTKEAKLRERIEALRNVVGHGILTGFPAFKTMCSDAIEADDEAAAK